MTVTAVFRRTAPDEGPGCPSRLGSDLMSRRVRASGWASDQPRVVWERAAEADDLDERPARTWVYRRTWFTVPPGPWPCETCSEYLEPGSRAFRRIISGEAVYRHPTCTPTAPPTGASNNAERNDQVQPGGLT